jgi:hypothetical protein
MDVYKLLINIGDIKAGTYFKRDDFVYHEIEKNGVVLFRFDDDDAPLLIQQGIIKKVTLIEKED